MSKEQDNKAIVGQWFKGFWGNPWNPEIVDDLGAPNMLLQYSLHAPRRGREDVKAFMTAFREAFPDLSFAGAADLIAEGDYVVGRWEGGGTHTGPAFSDFLIGGSLPAASGRKMRFTGTTVLRVADGKIAEEIGLDDGVTALQQLGLIRTVGSVTGASADDHRQRQPGDQPDRRLFAGPADCQTSRLSPCARCLQAKLAEPRMFGGSRAQRPTE